MTNTYRVQIWDSYTKAYEYFEFGEFRPQIEEPIPTLEEAEKQFGEAQSLIEREKGEWMPLEYKIQLVKIYFDEVGNFDYDEVIKEVVGEVTE